MTSSPMKCNRGLRSFSGKKVSLSTGAFDGPGELLVGEALLFA
jgi:hypothetical protein